jgi:DNA repair exonuclease SbcCD ATPase subunit
LRDKEISIFKETFNLKKELEISRSQNNDFENFEGKLNQFKEKFGSHYLDSKDKLGTAIEQIDDSIKKLQKVKDSLLASSSKLDRANTDLDEVTIKKLTYGNPTMANLLKTKAK